MSGGEARGWWRDLPRLAALTAVLLGLVVAGVLLDAVLERGDLAAYDPAITSAVISRRSAWMTPVVPLVTSLGSAALLVPLTGIVLAVLAVRRRWSACAVFACGMALSLGLTIVLKSLVGRERPEPSSVIGSVATGFAFPSGHTLNATVCFGLLAGLVLVTTTGRWVRVLAVLGWVLVAIGVGLSRVYLGVHWLTDVLAGWALGVAVLGLMVLLSLQLRHPLRPRGDRW